MFARLLFTITLCLSASFSAVAQIVTYQLSLTDSMQNILYVGFPNKIAIKNLPADARVKFAGKHIMPVYNNYILTPDRPGKYHLYVYDKNNKAIFSREFIANRIPDFGVQLGNVKYRVASVSDVMANPALVNNCNGCLLKPFWRLVNYNITLFINGITESKTVSGSNLLNVPFDKDIQNKIARMKNGDAIFIENIKGYALDENTRTLNPVIVHIAFDTTNLVQTNSRYADLRTEVRVIIEKMAADDILKGKGEGLLERLQEVATDSELVQLTDNENAVVKNYAFLALTSRSYIDPFPILLKHLYDTATAAKSSGCYTLVMATNNYFVTRVYPFEKSPDRYILTQYQQAIVDSILLFDTTLIFEMKDHFLSYMKPEPKYHNRIREIASSSKRPVAVIILAKFKNKNDIDLIKKLLEEKETEYYVVDVVREFPDKSFFPLLKKKFKKEWSQLDPWSNNHGWESLYDALAKYPTKETYQLFEKTTLLKDETLYQT